MARPILKGLARFLKTIQRSECIQALTAKPEIAITQSGLGISWATHDHHQYNLQERAERNQKLCPLRYIKREK